MSLIALEGIDGSGKTTLATWLSNLLHWPIVKFPSYSFLPQLEEYLKGNLHLKQETAFLLFLADIFQNTPAGPAILNRYFYSTIAYSTIPFRSAVKIVRLLKPREADLIIYIDIPVETSLLRSAKEHVYEKNEIFLKEVRERYLWMYKHQFMGKWIMVDGKKPLEEVKSEILAILQEFRYLKMNDKI